MSRVICAMSGGVDSSVAAVLLKNQGYEVIGVSMKLADVPEDPEAKTSGCCSVKDFNDARAVCDALEIPFYAMNFKDQFKEKVVNPFVSEYLLGRTPNPCVLCNQEIKFSAFLKKAQELNAEYVATGHYARIHFDPQTQHYSLLKGRDPKKDQSYFLFSLSQNELSKILFPVGDLTKDQVRDIARQYHLKTMDKHESQEICFVPEGKPGKFIDQYLQKNSLPSFKDSDSSQERRTGEGEFIDTAGNSLGKHEGIHHYTIGQRRGTQVATGDRIYIQEIRPDTGRIVLASDAELFKTGLIASKVTWTSHPPLESEIIEAKIRYRHAPEACRVKTLEDGSVEVKFEAPQRAITPGQAVVFYQGDRVLGGGWIERAVG